MPMPPIGSNHQWNIYDRTQKTWAAKELVTIETTAAQIKSVAGFWLSGVTGDNGGVGNGVFAKTTRSVHGMLPRS